jgi:hypothetical protein
VKKTLESDSKKITEIEPFWCAAANVKKENSFGAERVERPGTKHFRGGAKVYIADVYWGMCDSVTVIGHHRNSGRYIKIDIHVKRLENFRLELVYSPKVAALIDRDFDRRANVNAGFYTKEYAEQIIAALPLWIENYHTREE